MKKHLFSLLLVAFISLNFHFANAQAKALKIATFNCEFLTSPSVHVKYGLPLRLNAEAKKQWDAGTFRQDKFKEACKEVARVIFLANADIIMLTEVGSEDDLRILNEEVGKQGLKYLYMASGKSSDSFTKQSVGVLSKYPLSEVISPIPGEESFLTEPDEPESEDATGISKGMWVQTKVGDYDINLYVFHFASERGGHAEDMQRLAQASVARRHMLEDLKKGKLIIVAGDLNAHRGQPAVQRLRGFDDIEEDLIQTGNADYFDKDKLDTRWTYQYQGVKTQIDHILLSQSIKSACKRSGIKTETIQHNNPKASDHNLLMVTLNLR